MCYIIKSKGIHYVVAQGKKLTDAAALYLTRHRISQFIICAPGEPKSHGILMNW